VKFKAESILFLIALIWAGTFVVIKTTLVNTPPITFLAFRFLTAAILFPIFFGKKIKLNNIADIKAGLFLSVFLYIGFAAQTIGMVYTSASNSALITGISVLLVPFVNYLIIKKPVGLINWIGVIIVTSGLILLTKPYENSLNIGDLFTLVCAISWGFYIVYLDIISKKHNIYTIVFVQFLFVVILSFPLALIFEGVKFSFNNNFIFAVLYAGIPATLLSTYWGNKYQKETTPTRAAIIFSIEQPAAVVLAIIFINEIIDVIQITGGVLMVSGVLFSEIFDYVKLKKLKL
jgi:drug/metabolite transporter (DMT)-like permease